MKIGEFYKTNKHTFSFEFFPPKNPEGEEKLSCALNQLKPLAPSFVSVTYGAMGTTRANTLQLTAKIKRESGLEVAAHLTCIAHSRSEIEAILEELTASGIENIVALRGDLPKDGSAGPPPDGFRHAWELVRFIRRHPRYGNLFSIAVAGHPEGHLECRDRVKSIEYLKQKVDEGADAVLTQLFFVNSFYFDFLTGAQKAGIRIPIVPGIMPITNGPQIEKFAGMCGAMIPPEVRQSISKLGEDQPAIEAYGVDYATRQCRELLEGGAPGLHFYTLNRSAATRDIYLNLGLPC